MASIRKFQPNIPQEITLKFPDGKRVQGQFGEQAMYTLADGSIMYVPLIVEERIQKLGIAPGQPFGICKTEVREGQKKQIRWEVECIEQPPRKPQAAAALLDGAPDVHGAYEDSPALQTKLEFALRTALHAAKKAEEYSHEIGHPVQFDKDDIRLMAQTLVINGRNAA